ncbi:hypothetical protein GCM10009602_54230 [Nocardiopsis tropica]
MTRSAWAGEAIRVTPPTARAVVARTATLLRSFMRGIPFVVTVGAALSEESGGSAVRHHSEITDMPSLWEYFL